MRRSQAELNTGPLGIKDPKTAAGKRTTYIPPALVPELVQHLHQFAEPGRDGVVFVGEFGGLLRRQNFRRIWIKALADAGVPAIHFHDLGHTGMSLAAESGASLRDLMERMGHASTRAALIYLHSSHARGKAIAGHLDGQLTAAMSALDVEAQQL